MNARKVVTYTVYIESSGITDNELQSLSKTMIDCGFETRKKSSVENLSRSHSIIEYLYFSKDEKINCEVLKGDVIDIIDALTGKKLDVNVKSSWEVAIS